MMCVMLKAVPKPEGHDIAQHRADKAGDASKWLPENALYSAWEEMRENAPTKAMCVAWYIPGSTDGALRLRMRLFCETTNDGTALGADVFHRLTRPPE
jgi:hypothetical protein